MSIPLCKAQHVESSSRAATRPPRPKASFNPRHFVEPPRYPLLPPERAYKPTRENAGPPPTGFYLGNEAARWHRSIRETVDGKSKVNDEHLSYAECGKVPIYIRLTVGHLLCRLERYCDPMDDPWNLIEPPLYLLKHQDLYNVLIEHSLHRLKYEVPETKLFPLLRSRLDSLPRDAWEAGEKQCLHFKVNFNDPMGEYRPLKFRIDKRLYARCVEIAESIDMYAGHFVVLMILDSLRAFNVQAVESMDQAVETFYSQLRQRTGQLGMHFMMYGGIPEECRESFREIFPWLS